jgi:hypothetical protein
VEGSVHSPQLTIQEGATINGALNLNSSIGVEDVEQMPQLAPLRAARRSR